MHSHSFQDMNMQPLQVFQHYFHITERRYLFIYFQIVKQQYIHYNQSADKQFEGPLGCKETLAVGLIIVFVQNIVEYRD